MDPKRPGPVPRAPASDEETRPSQAPPDRKPDRPSRNSVPQAPADDRTELAPPRRPPAPPARAKPAVPDFPELRAARPAAPVTEETGAGAPTARGGKQGAVPQAPRSAPTRTQRVLANLSREWRYTAATVAGAVALAVAAWWLYANEHPILAAVAGVAVLPVLFFAFFVKRAPCPRCQQPVTIIGIEQCQHCREYIYVEGTELKLVGAGFIADWHSFELNVPLPIVPRLAFPTDRCCICGDRVDREETLEVHGTTLPVPHCVSHNEGAQWQLGVVTEAVPTVTFKFRSFDYWRAVRQANWAHVRAGMWR